MKNFNLHCFHLVDESPWPLTSSLSALFMTLGLVEWFHLKSPVLLILGSVAMALSMFQWWRDVSREGGTQGHHTAQVVVGLRWGMVLFITSEVLFFFSFFWAFFHSSLSPTFEIGSVWPSAGVESFNPFHVPLLNTAILLSSGVTVTWAHHALMAGDHSQAFQGLALTVFLGGYFTALQAYEYVEAPFTIADSAFGSVFFVATGFHGLHVLIGSAFLSVCLSRLGAFHFSSEHHFGFEGAAWYWHFVDVVWLYLFAAVYWWGGYLRSMESTSDFQSEGPMIWRS